MRATPIAILLAVALPIGCGPGGPEAPTSDASEAGVELARSDDGALFPFADGDDVELVHGPQGGYHFDVGVWIDGADPDGARLRYEVWEAGVDEPYHMDAVYALRAGRVTRDGDGFLRASDRALLDIDSPEDIVGHDVDVIAILELPDGSELSDGRTLHVVDEE